MKRKKLTTNPVRCSFCKNKTAEHRIVGGEYGSLTVCHDCYKSLKEQERKYINNSMSEGEHQAYSIYKVY